MTTIRIAGIRGHRYSRFSFVELAATWLARRNRVHRPFIPFVPRTYYTAAIITFVLRPLVNYCGTFVGQFARELPAARSSKRASVNHARGVLHSTFSLRVFYERFAGTLSSRSFRVFRLKLRDARESFFVFL